VLADATGTFSLGAEFRLARRLTLDIPVHYNPWTMGDGRKLKHWLVQPEVRLWRGEAFAGSFWGMHLHGALFNVSNLFSHYQFEGRLAGVGIAYGYRHNFNRRWAIEASIGAGYAYIDYTRYDASNAEGCNGCGPKLGEGRKHYLGVTRAVVALVYTFGRKSNAKAVEVVPRVVDIQPIRPMRIDTLRVVEERLVVQRHESGSACILFPVGSAVLDPSVAQNRRELLKIEQSMQRIHRLQPVEIGSVVIESYASPEGDIDQNDTLACRRAEALQAYMQQTYGLHEVAFTVRSGGENWRGLADAVGVSTELPPAVKAELLDIIGTADPDRRKAALRAHDGGRTYSWLLREVFPLLRVSSYRIDYTVQEE
jgi:outer membrane protein OmpA-like peptidoglycan-associated protein